MSSVVIAGNTSGSVTLAAPDVAGTTTLTLPATSGTVLTDASATIIPNGTPAFSAYSNSTASISSSTWTKVPVNVEEFDTASCYDSSTNYRFTPTIAGYYQINGQARGNGTISRILSAIRKNGSEYKLGSDLSSGQRSVVSSLVYMNGTTDYVELYIYVVGSGITYTGSIYADNYLNGFLARSA